MNAIARNRPSGIGLHSRSLAFAQREVNCARSSVRRAIAHTEQIQELEIPALREFSHRQLGIALRRYRNAIGKRAFEIRQLSDRRPLTSDL